MEQIQQKQDHFLKHWAPIWLFPSSLLKQNQHSHCSGGGTRKTDVLHVFRLEFPRVTVRGVAHEVAPCWFHTRTSSCLGDRLRGARRASLAGIQGPAGSRTPPQTLARNPRCNHCNHCTGCNHCNRRARAFSPRRTFSMTRGGSPLIREPEFLLLHQMFRHCPKSLYSSTCPR